MYPIACFSVAPSRYGITAEVICANYGCRSIPIIGSCSKRYNSKSVCIIIHFHSCISKIDCFEKVRKSVVHCRTNISWDKKQRNENFTISKVQSKDFREDIIRKFSKQLFEEGFWIDTTVSSEI